MVEGVGILKRESFKFLFVVLFVVGFAFTAFVKPAFFVTKVAAKPAFMDRYNRDPLARAELKGKCTLCHIGRGGGERNDFGEAFEDSGFRITSYQFRPRFVLKNFDDSGYIAPVVRYEVVRLDRTLESFYLNRSRATVGLNIAPSSSVILKFDYLFNHTFGATPRVPSGIGEPLFGASPLPHLDYGRNGFTGSVAYIF